MSTTLDLYNLSASITTDNASLKTRIEEFLYKFYSQKQSSFNKSTKNAYKVYASKVNNTYYLHINQFKHLCHFLGTIGYKLHVDTTNKHFDYDVALYDFNLQDKWKLYDYQEDIVNFLNDGATKTKLVHIQTGFGKGLISLAMLSKRKHRTAIVILPSFIEKWCKETIDVLDITLNNILVVQGSKNLKALIELAKEDALDYPFIIISSRTLQEFISAYEDNPSQFEEHYGITPIELFPLLGIGTLLIDESHMHFHAIFKILLYTNVKLLTGLTATLMSDDYVVKNAHNIVYPEATRYKNLEHDRYIDVYPVGYNIPPSSMSYIRLNEYGSTNYSHQAFEKSIMRNPILKRKYFLLIRELIEDYYITDYKEKDKLAVFVSSVAMATDLTDYIRTIFPQYSVERYCEEDPFENVIEPDIRVTTVLSAGTGIDIKGLRTVIQTINISSSVSNLQTLGRLRKLNDRDTKFVYMYCKQIPKHREYHLKRKEIFSGKVNSFIDRGCRTSL